MKITKVYTKYDSRPNLILVPTIKPLSDDHDFFDINDDIFGEPIELKTTKRESGLEGVEFITYEGNDETI